MTIPATVLTGFLGSGKTTLLNRLLARPELADTAVLINEFGEVGIDHLLVRHVKEDVVLLTSGCLCCSMRGDMVTALRDLFLKRVRGDIPEFRRLMIETTGLADPAPILHTLIADPLIEARYRLDGIVATVDAVNAPAQFDGHAEAVRQVAVADRLVLTKTDLASPEAVAETQARVRAINPAAPLVVAVHGEIAPEALLDAGLFGGRSRLPDLGRWLNEDAYHGHHDDDDDDHGHGHGGIRSFVVRLDAPVEWEAFATAMEALVRTHGRDLLRVKGVIAVRGEDAPVAIHGVRHAFHPPATLPGWPDGDERRGRIVFITHDLGRDVVERALRC